MSGYQTLTRDQWDAAVEALGMSGASEWRARNDIHVEGLDAELPAIDDEGGAPGSGDAGTDTLGVDMADVPASGNPGQPGSLSDLYVQLGEAQTRSREGRMQMLREATDALRRRRLGPDTSERLYAISAALLAPTRTRGLAGTAGNLMPVMQQMRRADREAEDTREDGLLALRRQYMSEEAAGDQQSITNRINLLKAQNAANKPRTAWSESLGRVIDLNTPQIIGSGVLNGQQVYKFSDGTLRMPQPNGTYITYDAGGRKIGVVDEQGNLVNGRP